MNRAASRGAGPCARTLGYGQPHKISLTISLYNPMFGFEHHMFNGLHGGWLWGMHWGGLVVWLVLIGGVLWAVSRSQQQSTVPRSTRRERPLDLLQQRYANGEISAEEYEERKQRLQRDR